MVKNRRFTTALLSMLLLGLSLMAVPGFAEQAKVENIDLVDHFQQLWEARRGPAFEAYVQEHGFQKYVDEVQPNGMQLMGLLEDGTPLWYQIDNHNAARTAKVDRLYPDAGYGYELNGYFTTTMHVWDAGNARATHQEFNDWGFPRVSNADNSALHFHATHVAGTMAAAGVQASAKGMSYQALLTAHDWNWDDTEMSNAANGDMRISNHSYGQPAGFEIEVSDGTWHWYGSPGVSETEDWQFGYYHSLSREWDMIAKQNPYYTIVRSAGNDRTDTGPGPGGTHYLGQGYGSPSTVDRDRDGGDDGYDCISHRSIAKNVLAVGAVNDVYTYYGPESVNMSSFSSWGPSDDGRIKPDLVANGVGLYSTGESSDADYFSSDGTSMSSPSAAGALNLILEQYHNMFDYEDPLSTTLRGVAIHTTEEAGPWDGPDYMYGWGLLNAFRAVELVTHAAVNPVAIQELGLANGETFTQEISPLDGEPLRITLMWLDAPGVPLGNFTLNDPSPRLVYDLDVRLVNTDDETTYYPYVLGGLDNPNAPAAPGDNVVDVVEQIYLPEVPEGNYEVRVSHKGFLAETVQYSLIISGALDANDVRLPVEGLSADMDYGNGSAELSWELPDPDPTWESFNIYQDGELIDNTTDTEYSASLTEFGMYNFSIAAVYASGESLLNPDVEVWFPEPVQANYFGYSIVDPETDAIRLAWEQSRLDTLVIDDGTGEFPLAFNDNAPAGIIAAQRITPLDDGTLHRVMAYLNDNRDFLPFRIHVMDNTDDDLIPGTTLVTSDELTASEEGWFTWQLPTRLPITAGEDFWIGFEWLENDANELMIDQTDENIMGRSVVYNPFMGDWEWTPLETFLGGSANGDFMLRAVMGLIENVGENGLVEYNVYRDGSSIGTTDELVFNETVPAGEHDYYIESVYEQGSADSDVITIEAGNLTVDDAARPVEFSIGDAYPNPFNPSLAVPVTLGAPANVRVVVYDVLGRQVTKLTPGKLSAGSHTINWTADDIASGVYFLRIQAGPMSSSQKVVLMR